MLEHGGRLRAAAQTFGIPLESWVDLSTGISPWCYPVPTIPETAWHRLPEPEDALDAAAARYYGNAALLATSGSQAAILPFSHSVRHAGSQAVRQTGRQAGRHES